jgi:hypothetical protein
LKKVNFYKDKRLFEKNQIYFNTGQKGVYNVTEIGEATLRIYQNEGKLLQQQSVQLGQKHHKCQSSSEWNVLFVAADEKRDVATENGEGVINNLFGYIRAAVWKPLNKDLKLKTSNNKKGRRGFRTSTTFL